MIIFSVDEQHGVSTSNVLVASVSQNLLIRNISALLLLDLLRAIDIFSAWTKQIYFQSSPLLRNKQLQICL